MTHKQTGESIKFALLYVGMAASRSAMSGCFFYIIHLRLVRIENSNLILTDFSQVLYLTIGVSLNFKSEYIASISHRPAQTYVADTTAFFLITHSHCLEKN